MSFIQCLMLMRLVMDLTQISHNINLAKLDNAKWVEYADALIHGSTVSKDGVPTYKDECIPCQWLYDHSDEVTKLYQTIDRSEMDILYFDIMDQIEILRYDLHENYLQIFKTYLPELNNSFFANLLRGRKRPTQYDRIDAKRQLTEMKRIADELNTKLDNLEQAIGHICRLNIA